MSGQLTTLHLPNDEYPFFPLPHIFPLLLPLPPPPFSLTQHLLLPICHVAIEESDVRKEQAVGAPTRSSRRRKRRRSTMQCNKINSSSTLKRGLIACSSKHLHERRKKIA
jgi:hypothetical protein